MHRRGSLAIGATAVIAAAGLAVAAAVARARVVRTRHAVVGHTGFAGRNVRLLRTGARSGTAYLRHRAARTFASAERRETLDEQHRLRTAEEVAAALGEMKGALMKLGQMASYLDEGMPEPLRDALASLQSDAPPMDPGLVAGVVRAELGDDPERVFDRWDPTPIASASIGQVHRAITRGGLAVAVKVQYPGVDRAIRSDLRNTDLLFRALGMVFPGLDPAPLVAELRARLLEELDYGLEAANQRLFTDFYRDHPFVHVPRVVDELSTARVLTTELATGARFAEVERWSGPERDLAAESIFRFVFRSLYRLHAFNGDPHPGNYLFRPGGRVTFLDFGLVKRYGPDDIALFESLIASMVVDRDIPAFRRAVERAGLLRAAAEISDDAVREYFGHFYEFVLDDREMTIDGDYASATVRRFFDLGSEHAVVARAANVPPSFVITQRINLGLHAVLGRLRATRNWRRIAEELWPFVDGPPSTPLGEEEAAWWAGRARDPVDLGDSPR